MKTYIITLEVDLNFEKAYEKSKKLYLYLQ